MSEGEEGEKKKRNRKIYSGKRYEYYELRRRRQRYP